LLAAYADGCSLLAETGVLAAALGELVAFDDATARVAGGV
jgi:hypothetical protein